MQVSVVNSYEAASLSVAVIKLRKVDCKINFVILYRTVYQARLQDYNILLFLFFFTKLYHHYLAN